ncbi:hypothetical protein AG1IA_09151 [Rhizoctonia solani AG-1 IA]|uniref:Uncharacterized protein n=1 Tax=Thanatephorus cucumeris (strain AG1-IA) TaxID=983506 RepID=L8WJ43_THACA|nr:hypothetical protein AG1IA_09151 [Rhizoctonia solani AG-1 IA]
MAALNASATAWPVNPVMAAFAAVQLSIAGLLALQELTKVSQMAVAIIAGLRAEPWSKSALLAGWKLDSVLPSNPTPNSMVGLVHVPKLGVVARASVPGPPPGAAGIVAKLVCAFRVRRMSFIPLIDETHSDAKSGIESIGLSSRLSCRLACGALHLLARISQTARVTISMFNAEG